MSVGTNLCVSCLLLAGLATGARGEDPAVAITVREPAGVARKGAPVSGGVPFKKGQIKSVGELALFDASGRPVPAQFAQTAPYEDGSVQWVLVDTLVDLPAGGKAEFVVKKGKAAAPARRLVIEEDGTVVTFVTGALTFKVDTARPVLMADATLDGRKLLTAPLGLALVDEAGKTCALGRPTRVRWEYRGPVRATLRLDGPYAGHDRLDYTVRITAWAGSGAVRIEHSIRNSKKDVGADATIREATLAVPLAFDAASRGNGFDWIAGGDGKMGLLLVDRHTGGLYQGHDGYRGWGDGTWPAAQKQEMSGRSATAWLVAPLPGGTFGFGKEGRFRLADCAHKDTEVWLDFYAGERDAAANEARAKALRARVVAMADPVWISETAALSFGQFGTLEDEAATYKKYGIKNWNDTSRQPTCAAAPFAFVPCETIHDTTECDAVELYLLMWLRTGQRGYFDWAAAWKGFFAGHAVYRTDGFDYDGCFSERSGVQGPSKRVCKGLRFGWYSPKVYKWGDTRMHMCHNWPAGLFDYYVLTGDTDALEAGVDMAEYALINYPELKSARSAPGKKEWAPGRSWGRLFKCLIHAYQFTRQERFKREADLWMDWAVKAPNRNERGYFPGRITMHYSDLFYGLWGTRADRRKPVPPRLVAYVKEHGITGKDTRNGFEITDGAGKKWIVTSCVQSFEFAACHEAVSRYARISGREDARELALFLARGARDLMWSRKTRHMRKPVYVGFPGPGKVYEAADWTDEALTFNGYHTRFLADVFGRAYTFSGDKAWLDLSMEAWIRGANRGYYTAEQVCPDDQISRFANHGKRGGKGGQGDGVDIRNCARLFYEAPRAK